jgi:lipoprotein NlpD
MKARKIFGYAFFAVIFFLTGCAGQRYHGVSDQSYPTPMAGTEVFRWPLEGYVIVPFGGNEEGVRSKGIVIEGLEGQTVCAAQSGTVVYVDEGLRGYGRTLIIEHPGNFSTVYARNAEVLVLAGQKVHQGQAIARVGRAGKGGVPRVYFELRKWAKPEDPQWYLK